MAPAIIDVIAIVFDTVIGSDPMVTAKINHKIVAKKFEYLTNVLFSLNMTPRLMIPAAVAPR